MLEIWVWGLVLCGSLLEIDYEEEEDKKEGDFSLFAPIFKNIWQYVIVLKQYRFVPLFRNSILLKSSFSKNSIGRKSSIL